MDCSTPGLPTPHYLPEFAQVHVHGVSDSIQPSIPSVIPFSSCPQSFPTSGSFQMSQFFASGGQSIRVSASASVLPVNIQDQFPLEWTGWISLQSKGVSRVFSNTTVQKHEFFGAQFSSVHFSHSVMSDSLRPHELQHARPPCPSPTPGVHSDSRPSSR